MHEFEGSNLLNDMFKFNDYYYKEVGSIDKETILISCCKTDWVYIGGFGVKYLLAKLEYCLKTFKIDVLGHMERCIDDMLNEGSRLEDRSELLNGSLDLAKKYNVLV